MRLSKDKRVVSLCLPGPNPANVKDIDFSHAASTFQPASKNEIPLECLRINAKLGRGKRFLQKRRVVTMPVDLSKSREKFNKPLPKESDNVSKPDTRRIFDKPLLPVKLGKEYDQDSRSSVDLSDVYRQNGCDISPMSSFDRISTIFDDDSLLMKRDNISSIRSSMILSVTSHSISGESNGSFEAYPLRNKSFDALTLPTLSDNEINVHETCIYDDMLACPDHLVKEDSLFGSDVDSNARSCLENEAGHFKNSKALNIHDRPISPYPSQNHDSLAVAKVRGPQAKPRKKNAQKTSNYRSNNASSMFSAAKSLGDSKKDLKTEVLSQPFKYPLDIGHDFVYSKYHFASTRNISLPNNQADNQKTNNTNNTTTTNNNNKNQGAGNKILSGTASRLKSAGESKIRTISSFLP
ncbi:Piso0_002832 [Millerozyma farinosa CBS 7064]|uniref:Piso0_002832 protein n=1 Tax=Pichia sorbitophila (strain ATCC MYA-4447 / BCRC 22081 / CBS 7064 / NBRC 10061 / NRRL Y-12695) TaxID=559304 RepID=G8YDM6_PICSO|nr:Piso0_002832 [Millerozyma farinosa CBS 7064]